MKPIHFYETEKEKKRKAEILQPHVVYQETNGFVTDKEAELRFIQNKLMNEFLSKRNLINAYNDFQNKEFITNRECKLWMKKWNVDPSKLTSYIKRP